MTRLSSEKKIDSDLNQIFMKTGLIERPRALSAFQRVNKIRTDEKHKYKVSKNNFSFQNLV